MVPTARGFAEDHALLEQSSLASIRLAVLKVHFGTQFGLAHCTFGHRAVLADDYEATAIEVDVLRLCE
jgi:hypothetical protein